MAYIGFGIFVLLAESNSVNLTDGLDGLAIGPVIICSFTFMLLAYAAGTTLRNFNIAEYLGMAPVPGAGLADNEIMTILVLHHGSNFKNFKEFYNGVVLTLLRPFFPGLLGRLV